MKLPLFVRRIERFMIDHALVVVLLVAFAIGVAVPWALRVEEQQRAREIAEAAVERRAQICAAFADQQEVTRAMIDVVILALDGGVLRERLAEFRDERLGPDDLPDYCFAEAILPTDEAEP